MFDNPDPDSDHEFYECAEKFGETLEPDDQDGGQGSGQDPDIPVNHAVR